MYDSSGRFIEPACHIILSEHQGVMGNYNAVLSLRQASETQQEYGSNQPLEWLDSPFLPREPYMYSFRILGDQIAQILENFGRTQKMSKYLKNT
jgi:hypothetical protein